MTMDNWSDPMHMRMLAGPSLFLAALSWSLHPSNATGAGDFAETLATLEKANQGIYRTTLENGITVLIKEDHSAPVAAIQIWVGTGAVDEGARLGAGLSHFVEHMIFKGTPTRKPGDITREINEAGGEINAYTAQDRTVFHCNMPAARWQVGLDVLADAVMNASFPEDEWQREREVILREMAMNRDDPQRVAANLLWSAAYRVHPYRVPIIGYEDVFKAMTREDLLAFFRENYTPDNMIVVVVGDIKQADAEAAVRERFAAFPRRPRAAPVRPVEPAQLAPRVARKTGAYELGRLHMAFHTVAFHDPDAPALDVLATIVGVGRSSRLVRSIKEEKRAAHDISAWSVTLKDPGLFGISATYEPQKETELLAAISNEVASWRAADFTEDELEKARRMVLVSELGSLQTMDGQASSYGAGEFYAGDPRFGESYLKAVAAVTVEQLKQVANRYLTPENATTVVLAPEGAAAGAAAEAPPSAQPAARLVLSNGVPLVVREDHRLPFAYVCIALRGGLLAETEETSGFAQLMSDLLTRGTKSRSSQDIAAAAERLGASLTTFAGRNSFGLQVQCLQRDLPALMDLAADCLLNPSFPADELEKQRQVQLAAIREQYERPFFVAEQALREMLFPDHPYRWTPLGSENSIRRATREDLVAFHRRLVVRSNIAVAIFGDVAAEEARALAERYWGNLPDAPAPDLAVSEPHPQLPARGKKREPREQTIVLMGYPGVRLSDPRADALDVIDTALSGLSSDLGMAVREQRGLAYYVGTYHSAGLAPGLFVVYAGTREDAADEVLALMEAEMRRVAENGLREDELNRAREQRIAAHQMDLQNNARLAQSCALNELYGLGYDYAFRTESRLRALTAEQIRAAAASLFQPDRRAVSLVLPAGRPVREATEEQP
jgi:zinc protease